MFYKSEKYTKLRKYGSYGLVHLGVNELGIFIKPIWLLGVIGEPDLLFPWKSIDRCNHSNGNTYLEMNKNNSTIKLQTERNYF